MKINGIVDHLFRHHYGKMVATLVRLFGLSQLEVIEDAVQDTFIKAMLYWKTKVPDNPEAWLTKAAKNRAIDLLRKIKADDNRLTKFDNGPAAITLNQVFLDDQIEDSQLRMIFVACHPKLNPKDQIALALKTIGGFSDKEIAVALLLKQETVKKRLTRARKTIKDQSISFTIPDRNEMDARLSLVHDILYLIFNEGFHSTKKELLIRRDLCGEAIRLSSLILKKEQLRTGEGYALFSLMCLHAARLDSKLSENNMLVDLKNQDRSKWHQELINLGNNALNKAMNYDTLSIYHIEAAIAAEHMNAESFEKTNWNKILNYHKVLHKQNPTDYTSMNIAIVLLQLSKLKEAKNVLEQIDPSKLEKRAYLYFGLMSEYYNMKKNKKEALHFITLALNNVSNESERIYLENKKQELESHS